MHFLFGSNQPVISIVKAKARFASACKCASPCVFFELDVCWRIVDFSFNVMHSWQLSEALLFATMDRDSDAHRATGFSRSKQMCDFLIFVYTDLNFSFLVDLRK